MSVTVNQLKIRLASVMPTGPTTPNVGGPKTTTNITGTTLGEVLFAMAAKAAGQGANTQHAKFFGVNTNGSDSAHNVIFWGENFADQMVSPAVPTGVSTSASDDATKTLRWMGYENGTGNSIQGNSAMNGLTVVNCPFTAVNLHRVTLHDTTSGALVNASGLITIRGASGVILGYIPEGLNTCTFEADFGLEPTLNDSNTIALPSTPPTGITLARPHTEATALGVVGGVLSPGAGVGIWQRWVVAERAKPSPDITYSLVMQILAA